MTRTTRRHLLRAAVGGASATGLAVLAHGKAAAAQKPGSGNEHAHDNRPLTGKRALVVVSFGQWDVDPAQPFDRQPLNSDRFRNVHRLLPFEVEVDAGGAVSFILSGVHQILVYADGTTFEQLQADFAAAGRPVLAGIPPLVDYPIGRIYRGLDPRVLNYVPVVIPPATTPVANLVQDRVESVNFREPGRYLVVCGVVPHFDEGMYGYVEVKA